MPDRWPGSSGRCAPAVSIDASDPVTEPRGTPARSTVAVDGGPGDLDGRVDLRERLVGARGAGEHAGRVGRRTRASAVRLGRAAAPR